MRVFKMTPAVRAKTLALRWAITEKRLSSFAATHILEADYPITVLKQSDWIDVLLDRYVGD